MDDTRLDNPLISKLIDCNPFNPDINCLKSLLIFGRLTVACVADFPPNLLILEIRLASPVISKLTLPILFIPCTKVVKSLCTCGRLAVACIDILLPNFETALARLFNASALKVTFPMLDILLERLFMAFDVLYSFEESISVNFFNSLVILVISAVLTLFIACIAFPSLCTPFAKPVSPLPFTPESDFAIVSSFPASFSKALFAFVACASICTSSLSISAILFTFLHKEKNNRILRLFYF